MSESTHRLTRQLWVLSLALAILHAWFTRHTMNADGMTYLDLAGTFMETGWAASVNAYWSPFYFWMMGFLFAVVHPTPYWEYPTAHLLNVLIFSGTLACFHFFLTALRRFSLSNTIGEPLPERQWLLLGYALFLWASLGMIGMATVNPDMCVLAFVLLSCGLLLRIKMGINGIGMYFLLGLALGLGYLSKAFLFPVGLILLAVSAFLVKGAANAAARVSLAILVFAVIAGPWVWAMSKPKERFTFGDSGRLNYAFHVGHLPWQHYEDPSLKHSERKLLDFPAVFEYATPVLGSYPIWYDPSYWWDGLHVRFDLKAQLRMIFRYMLEYFDLFWTFGGLIVALVVLQALGGVSLRWWSNTLRFWPVLVPAVAAMAAYSLVYLEERYIAAFFLVLWLGLFAAVGLPSADWAKRIAICTATTAALLVFARQGPLSFQIVHEGISVPSVHWDQAEGLRLSGIAPGSQVATLKLTNRCLWARLARVRVIAEVPDEEAGRFWAASEERKALVYQVMARAGATAIITDSVPGPEAGQEWRAVKGGLYVRRLP